MAAAMSHSQRTQHLYYTLKKGKTDAVEGYRVMEGVRRGEESRRVGGTRVPFTDEEKEVLSDYFGSISLLRSHLPVMSASNFSNSIH